MMVLVDGIDIGNAPTAAGAVGQARPGAFAGFGGGPWREKGAAKASSGEIADNLLKRPIPWKEIDFDFVPKNFDFVPFGLEFVPTGLGFVPPDLDFVPGCLENPSFRSGGSAAPRLSVPAKFGVAGALQNLAPNALKTLARCTILRGREGRAQRARLQASAAAVTGRPSPRPLPAAVLALAPVAQR